MQLVAVDTRDADGLLRGRLPAGGWADATSGLAPSEPVGGVRLTGTSADLVVSGHVADDVSITAALSLVVQDGDGARAALPAGVVALDGAPHALTVAVPPDVQVVAVDARLTAAGAGDPDQQSQTRVRHRRDAARRDPVARGQLDRGAPDGHRLRRGLARPTSRPPTCPTACG